MGKDVQASYNDSWSTLMQCVLAIAAKEEANHHVQQALGHAGEYKSEGLW